MKSFLFFAIFLILVIGSGRAGIIFNYSQNDNTLVGNNEDSKDPNSYMWFVPAQEDCYGRIYFGFQDLNPLGGMNDRGLVFDYLPTEFLQVNVSSDKKLFAGDLMDEIISKCATVKEALAMLNQYDLTFLSNSQIMLVDALGNSAIVEGEVIHRKLDTFQVATNFALSQFTDLQDYPCERYKLAMTLLENNGLSVDLFRRILADTHQEDDNPTQYSCIYDLKNGIIYLYHFHNYENLVRINLAEALKKGAHQVKLADIFPQSYAESTYRKNYQKSLELTPENHQIEKTIKEIE